MEQEKKVCVLTANGVAARPPKTVADKMVANGTAHFIPKKKYRKALKDAAKKRIVGAN